MESGKWKTKKEKRKRKIEKGKKGKMQILNQRASIPPNFFSWPPTKYFLLGSPSTWTYMGELNMPFSGRISRFAEFFSIASPAARRQLKKMMTNIWKKLQRLLSLKRMKLKKLSLKILHLIKTILYLMNLMRTMMLYFQKLKIPLMI